MSPVLPTRNEIADLMRQNQRMIRWFEEAQAALLGLGPLATLAPTGGASATTFLRGDGAWVDPFPVGKLAAWVNFNGTGVVAIRGAGNVLSITDSGVGVYVVNFAAALPDANYAVAVSSAGARIIVAATNYAAASVRIECRNETGTLTDVATVSVAVFR